MPLFNEDQLLAARVFDKLARLDYLEEALSAIRQDDYARFMKVCNTAMHKQLPENVLASVWTQVEDFFMKRVSFGSTRYATTLIDWHELSDPEGWKFSTKWEVEESGPPQVRDDPGEDPYPRGVKVTVTASKSIDGVPVVLQFWFYFEDATQYEDGGVDAAEPNEAMVEMPSGHGATKLLPLKEATQYLTQDFYELQDWLPQEAVDEYDLELAQYHRYNPNKPKWASAPVTFSLDELMEMDGWQVKLEESEMLYGQMVWSREGPEAEEPVGIKAEISAKKVVSGVPIQFGATLEFFRDQAGELTIEETKIHSASPPDADVTYTEYLGPNKRGPQQLTTLEDALREVAAEIGYKQFEARFDRELEKATASFKKHLQSMRDRLRRQIRQEFPKQRYRDY